MDAGIVSGPSERKERITEKKKENSYKMDNKNNINN